MATYQRQSNDPFGFADLLASMVIAAGGMSGMSVVHKYGRVTIASADTWEEVWSQGGAYTFPAAAITLGVSSASANDAAAGTGARTVQIQGLDASYALQTEVVTLNGTTKVETENTFIRVFWAKVLTAGSGGINAGKIYIYDTSSAVTDGVPTTATKIHAVIEADYGQTQMAIYTIPDGYTGFLISRYVSLSQRANQYCDVEMMVRPYGGSWLHKSLDGFAVNPNPLFRRFPVPLKGDLTGKADVRFRAQSTATGSTVAVEFDLVLVQDGILA